MRRISHPLSLSGHHISAEVGAAVRLMLEKNTTLQSLLFLCPCDSGHCIRVEDRISIEFLLDRNIKVLLFFLHLFYCNVLSHLLISLFQIAQIKAAEIATYFVRFGDGSTQRFCCCGKKNVTIRQLANCVATGKGRIDDGSVFSPFGHQPRLIFGGVLCGDSDLCESFRVGSSGGSSSGSGGSSSSSSVVGGGAEAAAADDLVFDVVCCPPCVWGRLRCVMHVTH
jgi:hypothetical protein